MLSEQECKPSERFLYANAYASNSVISLWKQHCIQNVESKESTQAYERFINWKKASNEIAVLTMYAYADLSIPKNYDRVFEYNDPNRIIEVEYSVTQSIWEAWWPIDFIEHGHKHLCVLTFKKEVPEIFYQLYKIVDKFPYMPGGQLVLGLCSSGDLPSIIHRREKILKLQEQYGSNWYDHDVEL